MRLENTQLRYVCSLAALLALACAWAVATAATAQRRAVVFSSRAVERPDPARHVSVIDGRHVWVGLAYSADGGASWTARVPPAEGAGEFFDYTHFVTASRGWLTGTDAVWSTADKGITWSRLFAGQIRALGFDRRRTGAGWMAVGDDHTVRNYVTRDLGQTWSRCGSEWQTGTVAPFGSVSLFDDKKGWITVARFDPQARPLMQGVARTEDGGCTWKVAWWDTSKSGENWGPIYFVDTSFGWLLSATYARVLKTSDGGLGWEEVGLPADRYQVQSGYPVDRTHGWILGNFTGQPDNASGILFTPDGGNHWQSVSKADLHNDSGLARQIPLYWGDGFLMKLLAMHDRKKAGGRPPLRSE